jgi:hypothetical protein
MNIQKSIKNCVIMAFGSGLLLIPCFVLLFLNDTYFIEIPFLILGHYLARKTDKLQKEINKEISKIQNI